jgi:hypothetical protein
LAAPGEWVGAFDFPFGLPRAFVEGLGWPLTSSAPWREVTQRIAALSRAQLIEQCRAWCDARPVGSKFAHRATDLLAGSSPSMKWINPPVALMLHAGAPRLLEAGVTIPGLNDQGTDFGRIALEGYPGLLARAVLGRQSYKSDDPKHRKDPMRQAAREALVRAHTVPPVVPLGDRHARGSRRTNWLTWGGWLAAAAMLVLFVRANASDRPVTPATSPASFTAPTSWLPLSAAPKW